MNGRDCRFLISMILFSTYFITACWWICFNTLYIPLLELPVYNMLHCIRISLEQFSFLVPESCCGGAGVPNRHPWQHQTAFSVLWLVTHKKHGPCSFVFCHFISDRNRLYLNYPVFYRLDYDRGGFRWIDCGQEQKCACVFEWSDRSQRIFAVFNFSDEEQRDECRTEKKQTYQLLIASDMEECGGERKYSDTKTVFTADKVKFGFSPFSGKYYRIR